MDYNFNNEPQQAPKDRSGIALASMITGIASIPFAMCTGYGGIILGLMGLLFGIFSKGLAPQRSTRAIVGIVMGIIGFILGIGMMVFAVYLMTSNPEFMTQYQDLLEYYNKN